MSVQKKTKRGVFIVDKQGKVMVAEQGGPQPTVDAVKRVVDGMGKSGTAVAKKMEEGIKNGENKEAAETAAEVADAAVAAGL
jgi:peroxiredoxin Q/BCP